ncbi:MAG TPA: galactose mutarotase [Polyangiaceae bacterium]|nr:galactose mutarotase [Polyangiaceae bacterium]
MPKVSSQSSAAEALGDLIVLEDEADHSRALIAPERGALVTSFSVGARELLYLDESTLIDATKNVRGGIPVLFPSPGKLKNDAWTRAGHSGTMKQHGFARNLPWTVASTSDTAALVTLELTSNAETLEQFPWPFHATLRFELSGASLRITARIENTGATPMPFALGYHPYFAVHDKARARIATRATRAYDNVQKRSVPFTGFDFTSTELDLHLLDHGASSCALLLADGTRLDVRGSPEFQRWIVWTLTGKDYVCLEPWTALGNALNTGEGLLEVEPGKSRELWVEFSFAHVL